MNKKKKQTLRHFITDVEKIFTHAIEEGNFSIALKAKELELKFLLLQKKEENPKTIREYDEEDLLEMLDELRTMIE